MLGTILAATTGDVTKAGKAIGLALGVGPRRTRRRHRHRQHLRLDDQSVARQPELRGELTGIQWLGFALTEAVVFYGLLGSILAYVLSRDPMLATSPLIQVTPGLMIWTIICFGITFFVLRKYAFRSDPADDRRASREDRAGDR